MNMLKMSESEIQKIAELILTDIVKGSNEQDWDLFSKYMLNKDADGETREAVELKWKESQYTMSTSVGLNYLGIIRKSDHVLVLWKYKRFKHSDEFLKKLYLQEINGEIKQIGTWADWIE